MVFHRFSMVALPVALLVVLAGCSRGPAPEATADAPGAKPAKAAKADAKATLPLLIAPEDLITVRPDSRAHGPLITGSIQPERRADLRAEDRKSVV